MEVDKNQLFAKSLYNLKLNIKQEVIPVDDSTASSCSVTQDGDFSQSSSLTSIKIKEEPEFKLNSLRKALDLNGGIRAALLADIEKIKLNLERNREKQAVVQKILDEDSGLMNSQKPPSQLRTISVFAAPYFRDVKKMVPPVNEDTILKRKNHDVNAYLKPPRPWTPAENKNLLDGVTTYALTSNLKPYKMRRDTLKRKMMDKNATDSQIEEMKYQIGLVEDKIRTVSEKPLHVLLHELKGKIDWMTVSATSMNGSRTPEECETMWDNYLNFTINKEIFTDAEDTKLQDLAEDYKEKNWDIIAAKLQTNRTAIQCFERYQVRLNKNLRKKYWTQEEDERLINLINEYKCGDIIPWNKISILMEGRTRQQIINRYQRSVSQLTNRGPWTPEEDALLLACYQKFGMHWNKMKDFFKKRSTYTIRERYCNALDPSIRVGPWTRDDDRLLISLIRKYGYGRWSRICKKIPGRTDNMCLVRASRLLEWSIKYHSDKGTGEYDPNINDPETFAKILRPCAPAKYCPIRNERVKSYRVNGLKTLAEILPSVIPDFEVGTEDLSSLDISWISVDMLHQLSEILHQMLDEKADDRPILPSKSKYITKLPKIRKREYPESDDEDYMRSPEVARLPKKERKAIDAALRIMFDMTRQIVQPVNKKIKVLNRKESAEMSLYQAYLYKQFQCTLPSYLEDSIENVTFAGVDFRDTLQTVLNCFIQPPVYENEFIILNPNLTTLLGMETVQATENRLFSMSDCVHHSKSYLDYLCERRQSCPECLQCLQRKSRKSPNQVSPQSVISDMKKKSFLINQSLEDSAYIESASTERLAGSCSCEALVDSQQSVQLLKKRFMSLFLWPALFGMTDFSKEQEHIICTERNKSKNYFWYMHEGNSKLPPVKTAGRRNGYVKVKVEKPETKVRKKYKPRKKVAVAPAVLRRSSRSCVLKRTSFAYPNSSDQLFVPETSNSNASYPSNMCEDRQPTVEENSGDRVLSSDKNYNDRALSPVAHCSNRFASDEEGSVDRPPLPETSSYTLSPAANSDDRPSSPKESYDRSSLDENSGNRLLSPEKCFHDMLPSPTVNSSVKPSSTESCDDRSSLVNSGSRPLSPKRYCGDKPPLSPAESCKDEPLSPVKNCRDGCSSLIENSEDKPPSPAKRFKDEPLSPIKSYRDEPSSLTKNSENKLSSPAKSCKDEPLSPIKNCGDESSSLTKNSEDKPSLQERDNDKQP